MKALDTAVTSLSTVVGHTKAWTKMNSPEIMLFAGIGAGIGALIMTQRATLKVSEVKANEEAIKKNIAKKAAMYEKIRIPSISRTQERMQQMIWFCYSVRQH